MSKLWSFLVWVIAAVITLTVVLSIIEPYVWIILLVISGVVVGAIAFRVWRHLSSRRGQY
jgi:hypothetical protein